jgi:isopentenyl-diphosphate delta-isomerase
MSDIERRKRDHLDIVLSGTASHAMPSGFDRFSFEHNALPEVDFDAIDLTSEFLGFPLRIPFLASSMTGGPVESTTINRALAEAAQQCGFAMGVGSQRIALTTPEAHGLGRELRQLAPDIPIFGNLGAVQLVSGMGVDDARRAVDAIAANALILHLNPLQEALQQGGDTAFKGVTHAIERLIKHIGVPVIVKEVGSGISASVAGRLIACGVAAIDVAGAGGTSWAAVEGKRSTDTGDQSLGEIFRNWGISTAECLTEIHAAYPIIPLIASGGIRHGLDAAKAIRLGASLVGQAAALLPAATQSTQAVIDHVTAFERALKIACFVTGSASLAALRHAPLRG